MRATLAFNGLINKPQKTNFIVNTQRSFSTVPKVPGKIKAFSFEPLCANPTKWSNTLKQFVGVGLMLILYFLMLPFAMKCTYQY